MKTQSKTRDCHPGKLQAGVQRLWAWIASTKPSGPGSRSHTGMTRLRDHALRLAIVILALGARVDAVEPLVLANLISVYHLEGHVEYLADPEGALTIEDVVSPPVSDGFRSGNGPDAALGTVVWFRLRVRSESEEVGWVIAGDKLYTLRPATTLYEQGPNGWTARTYENANDHTLGEDLEYWSRDIAFELNMAPGETRVLYLRTSRTTRPLPSGLLLLHRATFEQRERDDAVWLGAFYGILAAMVLYNLFLCISFRSPTYLYYCLFVATAAFWFANFNGLSPLYLWPERAWGFGLTHGPSFTLSMTMGVLFVRSFLNTRAAHPVWHRVGTILLFVLPLQEVAAIGTGHALFFLLRTVLAIVIWGYFLALGVTSLQAGFRPARFFLVAWVPYIVTGLAINLTNFNILPTNFYTIHTFQIAGIWEAVLLSLALADRINALREERAAQEVAKSEADLRGRTADLQNRAVRMEDEDDFESILASVTEDLDSAGIPFDTCSIDMVADPAEGVDIGHFEQSGFRYTTYRLNPDGGITREHFELPAPFPDVVRSTIERFAAGEVWAGRDATLGAIAEIPIAHYGRLRVSSTERADFSAKEIRTLQDLSGAIALGYARYLDFQEIRIHTLRKSAFLASLSHELRTPMNAIKGFTNLVLRRGRDEMSDEGHRELTRVAQSTDHLLAMINDLLDLSKLEAGQMVVSVQRFDVGQLIAACCEAARPLVKDGVELKTDLAPDLGEAYTDRERLEQTVINVLSNAARFTDTGSVTVRGWREGITISIAVTDTGPGIDAEDLLTLFDEYGDSEVSEEGGTGLGLTIARRFAQLLGGDIAVESTLGHGATFTITFPEEYHGVEAQIEEGT